MSSLRSELRVEDSRTVRVGGQRKNPSGNKEVLSVNSVVPLVSRSYAILIEQRKRNYQEKNARPVLKMTFGGILGFPGGSTEFY